MEASASQAEFFEPEQDSSFYIMPEQHNLRTAYAHLAVAEKFDGIEAQMLYSCRAEDADILAQIINGVNERNGEEKSVGIFTGDALCTRAQAEVAEFKVQQPYVALSIGTTELGQSPDIDEFYTQVAQEIEDSKVGETPPKEETRVKPRSIGLKVLQRLGLKS